MLKGHFLAGLASSYIKAMAMTLAIEGLRGVFDINQIY